MKLVSFLGTLLNSIQSTQTKRSMQSAASPTTLWAICLPISVKMNIGNYFGLMLARLSKVRNTANSYQTIHKFENSRNPSSNWLG